MSVNATRMLTGAALLGSAALLSACGGGNEDVIRQQGELRGRLEAQSGEVEALRTRVKDLEARSRSLEEQIAAVGAGIPAGPRPAAPTASDPGAEEGEVAMGVLSGEELASFLESEAGKDKLREFLKEEETRQQAADRTRRTQQMETMIRDRVTGYLTEQLALTADQQARVIDIATETMERMTELWRGARGGGDGGAPADFQAMREKSEEIRKESMDKLAQALTVDQYDKLEELGPAGLMMGGRGGFGGGRGGPGGGGRGGR